MTLAEGDIKVIREGETHLIAVCISGFVTSVVCFCALYTANKYRLYKGPHWLKLKTHPITSQNFVEFLQFSSVCRSPTVKLCCFMQHILEETETYVYTWVYPSSCHVWSLAVEGGGHQSPTAQGFTNTQVSGENPAPPSNCHSVQTSSDSHGQTPMSSLKTTPHPAARQGTPSPHHQSEVSTLHWDLIRLEEVLNHVLWWPIFSGIIESWPCSRDS